jgi:hypothetical protein
VGGEALGWRSLRLRSQGCGVGAEEPLSLSEHPVVRADLYTQVLAFGRRRSLSLFAGDQVSEGGPCLGR